MQTKSALASKGVWGGAIAAVTGLVNFFHGVNIVGFAQAIIDNWGSLVVAGSGIMAAWARIRASTFIAPAPPKTTVAPLPLWIVAALLLPALLGLSSCSTIANWKNGLSSDQQAQVTQLETSAVTIGTNLVNAAAAYGAAVGLSHIKPGNPYLDSVAVGLRTLEGTPVVTPDQVNAVIADFGDPNNKDPWNSLGTQVGKIITNYGAATVTNTALETAATALQQLNDATAKLQAKTALPPQASASTLQRSTRNLIAREDVRRTLDERPAPDKGDTRRVRGPLEIILHALGLPA